MVFLYVFVVVLSGGLLHAVALCLPQRPLWTLRRCHLNEAEHVLVQVRPLSEMQACLYVLNVSTALNACEWMSAMIAFDR